MKINTQQGVTLIELICGIAIIGIIMAGVWGILSMSLKTQTYTMAKGNNIQDASDALHKIAEELEYADSFHIGIIQSGLFKLSSNDNVASNNHYRLRDGDGNAIKITTNEIFFARSVFKSGIEMETQSQHIYLKNNRIVMDYAVFPQNEYPWTVTRSVNLTGPSIQELRFEIEQINDSDFNPPTPNPTAVPLAENYKRKKITITVVANSSPIKPSKLNDVNDQRKATFQTQVVSSNLKL